MDLSKVLNELVIGGVVVFLTVLIAWSIYLKTEISAGQQHPIHTEPQKAIYWQPVEHNSEPWRYN